jgi:hypothetical protein
MCVNSLSKDYHIQSDDELNRLGIQRRVWYLNVKDDRDAILNVLRQIKGYQSAAS